ncbi:MAG TPA: GNAT family N-acetyltransferase [Pyrinomonadaceae bacterium]|nr:GNAT family N-acetyltransferase [Pyrinomonadaceae bacterium]
MSDFIIRPISAAETHPLRSQILRPFQTPEELVFNGDDAADTLHAGAFLESQLVGIASVSRDTYPGDETAAAWKLRGMAVKPELQGRGYGRVLLEHCIAHVRDRGGQLLWCSGRTSALGFYRSLGFEASGEEYQVAGTGSHYRMVLTIPPTAE